MGEGICFKGRSQRILRLVRGRVPAQKGGNARPVQRASGLVVAGCGKLAISWEKGCTLSRGEALTMGFERNYHVKGEEDSVWPGRKLHEHGSDQKGRGKGEKAKGIAWVLGIRRGKHKTQFMSPRKALSKKKR